MAGCSFFAKIHLRLAYLQLEVDDFSADILTINTHRGLFKCRRLMYRVAAAPAIWQQNMANLLHGIPGVKAFLDDIRIAAKNLLEFLRRLEAVIKILHEYNIKVNLQKCEFFKSQIGYCGYIIDEKGIHKDESKFEAIINMPRPKNVSEVRAFIGMVNYYHRLIENASTILYPLYVLLRTDTPFVWTPRRETTFFKAKEAFLSEKCLAFYDPQLPLVLATDASSYGAGGEGRGRTLTPLPRRFKPCDPICITNLQ